ncbi:unnamed protein product [Didymodactylos carnosus]|uniref:Lipocalin/cytosolic fatty-acid binding domain-containing protein n=1 Tax=Didymodactylos carnosus TaxID=1234261 RepID=A0A813YXE8_9BILA|nr:unnamed protein product [Didymodactylos carnosus]CAF0890531.1 unnamed protein product [Didymodactylos carnosus]CAF3519060.1 unnamed protein product [Didymodactylos carnosus]CAF3674928.1 unnamed protein product [Didymodactylos carnosus]
MPDLQKLKGTWKYEDGEKFDDFLSELGISLPLRISARAVKPTIIITQEPNGKWVFKSESTFKTQAYEFEPNVEFTETRLDGEEVKSTIRFTDDGHWMHTSRDKKGKESTIERYVDEKDQQQVICSCGKVKSTRWYKRACTGWFGASENYVIFDLFRH